MQWDTNKGDKPQYTEYNHSDLYGRDDDAANEGMDNQIINEWMSNKRELKKLKGLCSMIERKSYRD